MKSGLTGVRLQNHLNGIAPEQLQGFFVGWPNPTAQAISDGVLTAFIPLLEVRPDFQGRGLGSALMDHLLAQLGHLYAVDLSCDEAFIPFYEALGFRAGTGMFLRRYERQSGAP